MRLPFFIFLLTIACGACDSSTKSDSKAKEKSDSAVAKTKTSESSESKIRNQISLKSSGVTVQQAFLMFEDGKLMPQDNKVEIGQKVLMRLIIKGWKEVNGKVFLGAAEKIATDEGQTVLDEKDLFANYTEGISPTDAATITLTAVITRVDKLFNHFEISFKVWDKNSTDNITGSYRVYLK